MSIDFVNQWSIWFWLQNIETTEKIWFFQTYVRIIQSYVAPSLSFGSHWADLSGQTRLSLKQNKTQREKSSMCPSAKDFPKLTFQVLLSLPVHQEVLGVLEGLHLPEKEKEKKAPLVTKKRISSPDLKGTVSPINWLPITISRSINCFLIFILDLPVSLVSL